MYQNFRIPLGAMQELTRSEGGWGDTIESWWGLWRAGGHMFHVKGKLSAYENAEPVLLDFYIFQGS